MLENTKEEAAFVKSKGKVKNTNSIKRLQHLTEAGVPKAFVFIYLFLASSIVTGKIGFHNRQKRG